MLVSVQVVVTGAPRMLVWRRVKGGRACRSMERERAARGERDLIGLDYAVETLAA